MRKISILLIVATLASSAGCCGRIRNWFHKGAPCGTTTLAPSLVGAPSPPPAAPIVGQPPVQMAPPVMTMAQPAACIPCCPDPCPPCCEDVGISSGGWIPSRSAYFGGFSSTGGDCQCNEGGTIQYATPPPATTEQGAAGADGTVPVPQEDEPFDSDI